jgi:hypothetical protein
VNKQVKELAIEAGATERSMCYGHGDYRTELVMTGEAIELFAKLVAGECASLFPHQFTDEQYQRRIDKTIMNHFEAE